MTSGGRPLGAAVEMSTSERLEQLAREAPGEKVTLGWILDSLHERAFGLFLLILALPCCIPFLYGIPQVVSLPLLFVAAQIVAGRRHPWLPERLRNRSVEVKSLADLARRAGPWLRFVEVFLRPRLGFLTRPPMDRLIGVALVVFSASIMVPLPLTNTVPGAAVALAAIGFLQRDGLAVGVATLVGSAWVAFLIYVAIFIPAKIFGAA